MSYGPPVRKWAILRASAGNHKFRQRDQKVKVREKEASYVSEDQDKETER